MATYFTLSELLRSDTAAARSIDNAAVGGAAASQHMKGEAADITTGSVADNLRLFERIAASAIPFDQLIDENRGRWIHISYRADGKNRRQVLHL